MLISQLPRRVRKKAIKNRQQELASYYDKMANEIFRAFSPLYTKEGYHYWAKWAEKQPSKLRLFINRTLKINTNS